MTPHSDHHQLHQVHQLDHQHPHHSHRAGPGPHEAGLAELLDLDAEVFGTYVAEVSEWVEHHASAAPRMIVDLGAGTGTGSLALARRFESAEVVALDRSALLLDRLRAAARQQGLANRVRAVQADVDAGWPDVGRADLVWASWSLHEFADPDRVLADVRSALNPGGLLVVVELDAFPQFLPDDVERLRPGLEARCREAIARAGWNAHPDWRPYLERAGFELTEQRGFTIEAESPAVARYADLLLRRLRPALEDRLVAEDLAVLDRLLSDDGPDALRQRGDLKAVASRTAWAGRRPSSD